MPITDSIATVVDRENWDGHWTICICCWCSIKSSCPGVVFNGAPLAQSMAKIGVCVGCLPKVASDLTNAVTPNTTNRQG